jgi:hypothetical protein
MTNLRTSSSISNAVTEVSNTVQSSSNGNISDEGFKELLKEKTGHDWWVLGSGSGRVVVTNPQTDIAYKIARPRTSHASDGVVQNTVEAFAYNNSIKGESLEDFFLPVVNFDKSHLWVAMPHGSTVTDKSVLKEAVNKIHRKVDWLDRIDVSAETRQFVRWDGSVRLADYGQFEIPKM